MDISELVFGRTDAILRYQTASQAVVDSHHRFDLFYNPVALNPHSSPQAMACRATTPVYPQNYDVFIRFVELDSTFKTRFGQISLENLSYQINAPTVLRRGQAS
jgi:hypothetical protein